MKTVRRPSRNGDFYASKTTGRNNFRSVSKKTYTSSNGRPNSTAQKGGSFSHGSKPSFNRSGSKFNQNAKFGGKFGGNRKGGRRIPTFDPSNFINTNPTERAPEVYIAKNTFKTFGLNNKLAKTIEDLGITIPSPIQDQIIPEIMKGNDVVGLAETGTGKTAAFLIPLIEKTLKDHGRQSLVMAPTRELAIQINEELRKLSRGFNIYSTVCVGGMNIGPQIRGLRRKNHFVIGTPGRILDLIKRKNFDPSGVSTVVLDEADRMLDMGFIHDMRKILETTPTTRETLFFSATMIKEASNFVSDFLKNPVRISVKKKDVIDNIGQDIVHHTSLNKFETLSQLLTKSEFKRVLVFGAMKHSVNSLAKNLLKKGISAGSIHGNKSHGQRQRALDTFKSGNTSVLVATDVAARGIHVEDVTHVINYDLPNSFEDYVHRIGRTGRGTKRGMALTFVLSK
jgi:ATP-dependent RNA helicase RhlE